MYKMSEIGRKRPGDYMAPASSSGQPLSGPRLKSIERRPGEAFKWAPSAPLSVMLEPLEQKSTTCGLAPDSGYWTI
jgi:hypothetical protein